MIIIKNKYTINDFRLATPEEQSNLFSDHSFLGHTILLHPKNITPYYVYMFLKERFGNPNIPSNYHDYRRITWEYLLKGPRGFISIHDWKLYSWSFSIRSPLSPDQRKPKTITKLDDEARKDAKIILNEIMQYLKKQKKPSNNAKCIKPVYQYLQNIFFHNYSCAEHLLSLYEEPKKCSNKDSISDQLSGFIYLEDRYLAWASALSFVLSVEGLFNLIYEIYLNPEIARDEELRRHIYRMSLKDKWLTFSFFCSCFSKVLDRKSKGFQNLNQLIQLRHYWAHSNIGEDQREYIIEEDGLEFVVSKKPKFWASSLSNIDFSTVKKIKDYVDLIKIEIIGAMKPKIRKSFLKALEKETIVVDEKGKLIIY